jgi:hypothetical protein
MFQRRGAYTQATIRHWCGSWSVRFLGGKARSGVYTSELTTVWKSVSKWWRGGDKSVENLRRYTIYERCGSRGFHLAEVNWCGIHSLANFTDAFYDGVSHLSWPQTRYLPDVGIIFSHKRSNFDHYTNSCRSRLRVGIFSNISPELSTVMITDFRAAEADWEWAFRFVSCSMDWIEWNWDSFLTFYN